MAEQDFVEWPTLKLVMSRIKREGDKHVYQGSTLEGYSTTLVQECGTVACTDLNNLDREMRTRLEWSDTEMLRSIITFTDTQSWAQNVNADTDDIADILSAVECITTHFREPLLTVGTNLATIRDEVEEIVEYARRYLSIQSESYQIVWFKRVSVKPGLWTGLDSWTGLMDWDLD